MEDQPKAKDPSAATKTTKRLYAVLAALIFVVLVAAVFKLTSNHNSQTASKTAVVRITAKGFEPDTIAVKQGTKIIWTNTDNSLHQIYANPFPSGSSLPNLKSEILNESQTYTYTATKTGSFGYHDQLKPTTNGTLVVKE